MAANALHSLALLLDTWGVSADEFMHELLQGEPAADAPAGSVPTNSIRWERFMQVSVFWFCFGSCFVCMFSE